MKMNFMMIMPTIRREIYSVLEGIKKVAYEKKITSVFQPHDSAE